MLQEALSNGLSQSVSPSVGWRMRQKKKKPREDIVQLWYALALVRGLAPNTDWAR